MYKELLAAAAIVIAIAMYVPYIRSIHDGRTKPQAISWITWTLAAFIVFFAQLADRGGAGAWSIGVSGLVTGYVAVLAYRNRTATAINRSDWVFLAVAVAALPGWWVASDPLVAVVLLTGVELAGFGPTFRSAVGHPKEERIRFFLLGALRNTLAVAALEHYSLTTVLFPAAKGVACVILVAIIAYRRTQFRLQVRSGGLRALQRTSEPNRSDASSLCPALVVCLTRQRAGASRR